MGFSLELFFIELLQSLKEADKGQATIENIIKEVEHQRDYAKQCGKI